MRNVQQSAIERAQRGLVGLVLEVPEIASEVSLPLEAFPHPLYRAAWAEVSRRSLARETISFDTVTQALAANGERVDFLALLRPDEAIRDDVPAYEKTLRAALHDRQLRIACSDAINDARKGEPALDVAGRLIRQLGELDAGAIEDTLGMPELIRERFSQLRDQAQAKAEGRAVTNGVPTGISDLDEKIGGLQVGVPTILAARPSMGKSAVALAMTLGAVRAGHGVHVFSLEDTRESYMDRVIAQIADVSPSQLRQLDLTREELSRVQLASESIRQWDRWKVDDRAGVTAADVVRKVRRCAKTNGTKLVVVDYITLLRPVTAHARRDQEITESINILGDAARNDGMAYLVLSQLNRGVEGRTDRRPMLSDLRESGGLEERAKCVLMLYREGYYNDTYPQGHEFAGLPVDQGELEILIRKNNQGPTGYTTCRFDLERVRVS